MLGPFADQMAVDVHNCAIGTDRPMLVQYADWISGIATGDLGQSCAYRYPVAPFLGTALLNSAKLAAVAFCLVVLLGICGGVIAVHCQCRPLLISWPPPWDASLYRMDDTMAQVKGPTERIVAIFEFFDRPGVVMAPKEQAGLYGRSVAA